MEWDWVEVTEGTVAQADPLNVRSTVLLLDDRGRPLLSSRRRTITSPYEGTGYATSTADEPEALQRAARSAAAEVAAWIEYAGRDWPDR